MTYWTKQLPTADGYYWWRENMTFNAIVVMVRNGRAYEFMTPNFGYRELAHQGGEWSGPIQEPGLTALPVLDQEPQGTAITADKQNGLVRIDFGKPVAWLALGAKEALALGEMICDKALSLPREL